MREIKFRVWDKEKKLMVHDFDQSVANHYPIRIGDSIHNLIWKIGYLNETLMQYTGLRDKSGKEIYEGDIVRAKSWGQKRSWNSKHNTTDRLVAFHNGAFRLCCGGTHYPGGWGIDSGSKFEVIGNIYENPELLENENS